MALYCARNIAYLGTPELMILVVYELFGPTFCPGLSKVKWTDWPGRVFAVRLVEMAAWLPEVTSGATSVRRAGKLDHVMRGVFEGQDVM